MKIDRLIGILSILLRQEQVTAPELAKRFEVSRRTVSRDIEALCKAGIPIVTAQGKNGGISIMEGYRIDKTLLTSGDMKAILAGLGSLDSVSKSRRYQQLMDKLSMGNSDVLASGQNILIDLSSWYKTSLAPKIERIQAAIEKQERISFLYFSPRKESRRIIEPYYLIFHWISWYVWGRCCEKEDYRLFKLNRMTELEGTGERFERKEGVYPDLSLEQVFPSILQVKVLIEPQMKWRLVEEYGTDSFREQEDGRLLFTGGFADKENMFEWLLSFGSCAELLEPQELRGEFIEALEQIRERYRR